MLSALSRFRDRLAEWWAVEDPEDRIEGSGEPYLDPAYNPSYTAERRLKETDIADQRDGGGADDGQS
jgi:hypothetical protein